MLRRSLVLLALVPAALVAQVGATTSVRVQNKVGGEVSKKPGGEASAKARVALVAAGRAQASADEMDRAALAIERGYTAEQIQVIAKAAPADRPLVVAFDVLSRLLDNGVTTADAVTKVQAKLEAKDPDASIEALVEAKHQNAPKKP
ncbi:MAG TPA: hypothetical protein VFT29_18405 [Gemmatimonadaceae bacterium]|nr:hypothetical protein [Gemmatimonadaceae bacterium]